MSNFEFVNIELTPEEKHVGIISVTATVKTLYRYKIVPTKDGTSKFPAPASYKVSEDRYIPAFQIDSASEHEKMVAFLKQKIAEYFDAHSVHAHFAPVSSSSSTKDRKSIGEEMNGEELPF